MVPLFLVADAQPSPWNQYWTVQPTVKVYTSFLFFHVQSMHRYMWYTYEYKNFPYWKSYVYKLGITPYNSWFLNGNMARLSQNQRLQAVGMVEAGLRQYDVAVRFGVTCYYN